MIGNRQDMPYLNRLATQYGLATNYYADAHPSINNYFFLMAGHMGTFAPWIRDLADLFPFDVGGENVASILSDNGKSWKVYAENMPGRGYVGDDRGLYVKRHNPLVRVFRHGAGKGIAAKEYCADWRSGTRPPESQPARLRLYQYLPRWTQRSRHQGARWMRRPSRLAGH